MKAVRAERGVLLALDGDDTAVLRAVDAPGSGLRVVRRCADAADLLSAAMAGLATLAVVDVAFDEVDRSLLDSLRRSGLYGVLRVPAGTTAAWTSTGWQVVELEVGADSVVERLQRLVQDLDAGVESTSAELPAQAASAIGGAPAGAPERGARDAPGPAIGQGAVGLRPGRLVAVWGPQGAPGRSTLAASLAFALSRAGGSILVDADLEAPCLTQLLGLPEDSSGLATAARLAGHGRLDDEALAGILLPVGPGERFLSGLGRSGRWRELPPPAMKEVWRLCRRAAAWTVVDLAGGTHEDAVDGFTLEPGPGAVSSELIGECEVLVVVGSADPIGIRRLLQLLDEHEAKEVRQRIVVLNRLRSQVAGPSPASAVQEALARFGGISQPLLVPDDPATADRCLMAARCVLEEAPGTALGRALAAVADRVEPRCGAEKAAQQSSGGLLRRLRRRGGAPERSRTRRTATAGVAPPPPAPAAPGARVRPPAGPVTPVGTAAPTGETSPGAAPPPPPSGETRMGRRGRHRG